MEVKMCMWEVMLHPYLWIKWSFGGSWGSAYLSKQRDKSPLPRSCKNDCIGLVKCYSKINCWELAGKQIKFDEVWAIVEPDCCSFHSFPHPYQCFTFCQNHALFSPMSTPTAFSLLSSHPSQAASCAPSSESRSFYVVSPPHHPFWYSWLWDLSASVTEE